MRVFTGKISLSAKLVFLYAALLITSVLLVSYYSYWNIWQLFITSKTSHIRARAKPVIEHWLHDRKISDSTSLHKQFTRSNLLPLARDLTSKDTVAVILNRQGTVLAGGRRLPEEPIPPPTDSRYLARALAGENEVTYWSKGDTGTRLVFLIPLRLQPDSPTIFGIIQMSTSLADIDKILFRYGSMQMAAVAVVLLGGILCGYLLIRYGLRDLQGLAATCREIARGNFSRRTRMIQRRDEIGHLARSFNLMIEQLEKMFDSQKRFVGNAAHELLTPLTGLRGSLEVLLRGAQDDPEAVNRLSKGMYKEVNRLIRICDQLLAVSKLESSSHVEKQDIEIPAFMADFSRQARILARNRTVDIRQGPPLTLMADPDLLEQILLNLLSNAVRYSPVGTTITIGWKALAGTAEIWLADQGRGMDETTLTHLFEPFYRGSSARRAEARGAGLGLALTKTMVEAQGGTIHVNSSIGRGTTVFFTIPLAAQVS